MAKKSSGKKKGPKGKKARAKAKLEKRWGEEVDEDALKKSKIRQGKSRLKKTLGNARPKIESPKESEVENAPTQEQIDSDEEAEELESGAFSSLLRNISQKRKSKKPDGANFDDDDNSMDVEDKATYDEQATESSDDIDLKDEGEEQNIYEPEQHDDELEADDPFTTHFSRDPLPEDGAAIAAILKDVQSTTKVANPSIVSSVDVKLSSQLFDTLGIKQEQHATPSPTMWTSAASSLFEYNRKVLKQNWKQFNRSAVKVPVAKEGPYLNNLQSVVYPAVASYADVLVTAETFNNRDTFNNLISLHVLNHILTARGRVQRNNKRVKDAEDDEELLDDISIRDQGFTRASALILLPTRGLCYSFVNSMLSLLGDAANIENRDRFEAEYGPVEVEEEVEDSVSQHRRKVNAAKGIEWNELLGDQANSDDDFKLGLSFSTKSVKQMDNGTKSGVGVRLYTDFYKSDIIIASPLGLKITAASGEEEEDVDYLSSIEICYIGSSDVLMMQNWDHVDAAFEMLNQKPTKNNGTDFSRVREYLLAGQARYWRQLIMHSKFTDPCILSTFKRNASSTAGVLKIRRRTPSSEAALVDVVVATKQVFQRVPCKSFAAQGIDRLDYFAKYVLPQIERTMQKHTLIYVPSYFEFISLRNLLLKKEVPFVSVTEYARVSEVSRGRARFLQGRKPIMLYTGRSHFFSRHTIKGAKHLIFYGLPENSEFYSGVVNMLNLGISDGHTGSSSCLALFTKYEAHALERICGRQNGERMVKGEKSTFMFVS